MGISVETPTKLGRILVWGNQGRTDNLRFYAEEDPLGTKQRRNTRALLPVGARSSRVAHSIHRTSPQLPLYAPIIASRWPLDAVELRFPQNSYRGLKHSPRFR